MRLTNEELQKLMKEQGANNLFSWSKINMYYNDPYSYLLRYIKKVPPDRGDNSYSFFGGEIHSFLESFYSGELTNEDMITKLDDKIFIQELSDMRFDVNDERNESIKAKYITCIKHFLREYEKDENAKLEHFVYGRIGQGFFQGYIDKMHVVDNILYIDDFKTSTKYSKEKIENEKGQLFLYAILLHQMYGIPYSQMKARWNFLKYVAIDYEQINGKIITTFSERHCIGDTITAKAKAWLKKYKYTDTEIDNHINQIKDLNENEYRDKDCIILLPEEIKDKFKIYDALVDANLNEDDVNVFVQNIENRIEQIIQKESLYEMTQDEKLFWSTVDKSNSYYYSNLCNYSAKYHKPLKEYYDNWEKMSSEENILTKDEAINKFLFG